MEVNNKTILWIFLYQYYFRINKVKKYVLITEIFNYKIDNIRKQYVYKYKSEFKNH